MEPASVWKFFRFEIIRIIVPPLLTILLFVTTIYFYFFPVVENSILQRKRENVQEAIQIVWSTLDSFEQLEKNGQLSRPQAQKQAIDLIKNIRYGAEMKDYFWINDLTPRMIMHPYRTDLDGQDLSNFTDPNGKRLFVEMVKTVKESEAGYVDYIWQWKDDSSILLPKVSYVRLFEPWGWIVGTGIYIADVEKEIRKFEQTMILTSWSILGIVVCLALWIIHQRYKSELRRESAEAGLQYEQRKLLDIIEFLPDATFVIDAEKRVIAWNRAIEKLTGMKKENILGKGNYEYAIPFYGNARPILIDFVMEQKKEISDLYFNFIDRNGYYYAETFIPGLDGAGERCIMATASALVDRNGSLVGAIESMRDITEQKQAERMLRTSEENYRAIFNGVNETIFVHDPQTGKIMDVNQKASEMYGFTRDEFLTVDLSRIVSNEEPFTAKNAMEKILKAAQGIAQVLEWQARTKNGSIFWIEVNLKRVSMERETRVLAVIRDIDQRKKYEKEKQHLEEQLRQSQKMEAVGKLAGGVAHDFNNLLTVIHGYSDLALTQTNQDESLFHYLDEVKKAATRAEFITRQLLAFSRRQIIQPKNIDLNFVIKNLEKMLRRLIGEDIDLRTALRSELHCVRADPNQIEQVVINLAVNARDSMPKGGKLTIETQNAILDDVYAQQHVGVWPGSYVMLAVSDTGCGMNKETQARIFEPFFTTKGKGEGTGLGLSMVYGIVKQNGGNIYLYSEVGKGTVFKIYLPRVREDIPDTADEETSKAAPRGTETILLVEDELSVILLVEKILIDLGYDVLSANDVRHAQELFETEKDRIDLVLTDVIMPHLSGRELADRFKEAKPDLKVLYMSGYTDNAVVHHGILEPGIAFIQKPFESSMLAQKVRKTLDE